MKRIIGLYGKANSGKSSTLNLLIDHFIDLRDDVKPTSYGNKDRVEKFEYNDKTIGIATGGDSGEIVRENFEIIKDCEILVMATRCSGKSSGELYNIALSSGVKIEWLKHSYCLLTGNTEFEKKYNQLDAESLFFIIDKL